MTTITASRLLQVVLVSSALVWGGCSSTGVERAEDTAESMQDSVANIEKGKTQIKKTMDSLNKVQASAGSDPRSALKEFSNNVEDIKDAAKKVRKTTDDMKDSGKDYYKTWQKQLSGMNNEQLKAISSARQAESQATYEKVVGAYNGVREAYKPFIKDLTDIQTYLSNDLTPGGISAIKPVADRAETNAAVLNDSLSALQANFSSMAAAIAPYKVK
jgi:uncharacterized phage infection (PIP) family protein YhgE